MLKALRHLALRARIAWLEYRQHSARADLDGFADAIYITQVQMRLHNQAIAAWDQEIINLQAQLPRPRLSGLSRDTVL